MRVLLPLKKKLSDANSSEQDDHPSTNEVESSLLVVVNGEVFQAPEEDLIGASTDQEAWDRTEASEAPDLVALDLFSADRAALAAAGATSELRGNLTITKTAESPPVAQVSKEPATPLDPLKEDYRFTGEITERGPSTLPRSLLREYCAPNASRSPAQSTAIEVPPVASLSAASLSAPSVFAALEASATTRGVNQSATPDAALVSVSAPTPTNSRLRKRRSTSPVSSSPASKPSSKKGCNSSKPPARKTPINIINLAGYATRTSSHLYVNETCHNSNLADKGNNSSIMAGGRDISRGGRNLLATNSSYYVENNSATGGREDVANSYSSINTHRRHANDNPEVEVRCSHRHENDPASARGDVPTNSINNTNHYNSSSNNSPARVPPFATASLHKRHGTNNTKRDGHINRSSHAADCGRDDEVVREHEVTVNHHGPDEDRFALALKKQGLEIVEQEGDGNCLFRAISLQVYGDASMHGEVRNRCLDFMARDKEHFSQFITDEPFEQYIQRKRHEGVHGNNPEIQATSELFNRPIEVFVPENGAHPLNIFHAEYKTQDAPIRLSYHDRNHYNAVIDPLVPTAGLGLGLPGLQPGLADKMQMAKAVAESDRMADQREFERALEESQNDQLQRAIKESSLSVDHMYQNKAISLSDCDATNFELEQAVLESSLESFRTYEHGRKQSSSTAAGVDGSAASDRRKRHPSPSHPKGKVPCLPSMPVDARQDTGAIPRAASAAAVASASAAAVASRPSYDASAAPMMAEHYPQTVQELVMNGFELRKVVHAYELVGDNFDDLLMFLMSNTS